MPPESAEVIALRSQIEFMRVIIYAESAAIVAISGFFVAWIRTLYDGRISAQADETENRDKLLERVLQAISEVTATLKAHAGLKRGQA